MKTIKIQKGITLVALVIAIVILLILAGVTLAPVIDERLFKYAENATNEFENLQSNDNDWLDRYKENLVSKLNKEEYKKIEYKKIEYIESTGTQYIDTGIKLTQDFTVELEFEITEEGNYNVFGSRTSATENNIGIIFSREYNEVDIDFQNFQNNRLKLSYDTSRKIYKISNEQLKAGSNVQAVLSYTDFTTPDNAYIFNMSGGAPAYNPAKMKLYYCKIYNNSELVRNFIPCYRGSDNKAGLFDTVNEVFYTNQGTGEFVRGPEVTQ